MLILQGERDYQVTLADLNGWRAAVGGHAGVTIKSYPTLNHLFLPGEGKSTPAEYERAGHIPDVVLDDIADWTRRSTSPEGPGPQWSRRVDRMGEAFATPAGRMAVPTLLPPFHAIGRLHFGLQFREMRPCEGHVRR